MTISDTTDFTANALTDFPTSVTWTPRTKVIDNRGDRTFTNGTSQTINVVLHRTKTSTSQDKQAETVNRDGYIMFNPTNSISREDLIEYNGETWFVGDVVVRGPAEGISLYGYADIFLINDGS